MKHAVVRALGISLSIGLVASPIISAVAFSGLPQNQPAPEAARFSRLKHGRSSLRGESPAGLARQSNTARPGKAWLLEPGTFERLSSAGQRAALRLNGLLHLPRAVPGAISQETVRRPEMISPGDNIRVDNPALDIDGHTHSETSITVNGSNIVETFNDASNDNSSGYAVSTDGGSTFAARRIPIPPNGINAGDGVASYGPSGELYYSQIAFDAKFDAFVGVSKSTDNGTTFTLPVNASTTAKNAN